jgi:glycosyltransferase involved in cell wall biosynthesis
MPLAEKARDYGIRVYLNPALGRQFFSLFSPGLLFRIRSLRSAGFDAIIHAGSKTRAVAHLLGHFQNQYVVFHTARIGGRKYFPNWIALTKGQELELNSWSSEHHGSARIFRIPNGPLPSLKPSMRNIGTSQIPVIGILARLVHRKGVDIALDAASNLHKRGIPFRLLIGGDGPELENLKRQVDQLHLSDQVEFLGWITDIDTFYDQVDIFCMPSRSEPFGLVLVDAMSRGRAVVASRTEGPLDIINDREDGYLFDVDDVDDLVAALESALASPTAIEEMGRKARENVELNYSLSRVGGLFEAMIRQVRGD